jgi:hypothetical protein
MDGMEVQAALEDEKIDFNPSGGWIYLNMTAG